MYALFVWHTNLLTREPLLSSTKACHHVSASLSPHPTFAVAVLNDGDCISSTSGAMCPSSTVAVDQQEILWWSSSKTSTFPRAASNSSHPGCCEEAEISVSSCERHLRAEGKGERKAKGGERGGKRGVPCQVLQSFPIVDVLLRYNGRRTQ